MVAAPVVVEAVAVVVLARPEVVQVLERARAPAFDRRQPSGPGWRTVRRPAGHVA